jgi:hypothetical protein
MMTLFLGQLIHLTRRVMITACYTSPQPKFQRDDIAACVLEIVSCDVWCVSCDEDLALVQVALVESFGALTSLGGRLCA